MKVLEFDFEIRVETLLLVAFQLLFKVDIVDVCFRSFVFVFQCLNVCIPKR